MFEDKDKIFDSQGEENIEKAEFTDEFFPEEKKLPFSHVWCGKEAVSKLVGDGMACMMQVKVGEDFAEFQGKRYALRETELGEYRLVIATEEGWDYGAEALSEKR